MFILPVLVLANLLDYTYQATWSYDDEQHWPGECLTGKRQSPINIIPKDAIIDRHGFHIRGKLKLSGYSHVEVTGENNGHTLQWTVTPKNKGPILKGGPLRSNYTFLQFHLHWLSEHSIDGYKYPLEIHMVHIKTGLSVSEAVARPDGIAVIGVLAQVKFGSSYDYALNEIMPMVPDLIHRTGNRTPPVNLDMSRLFSHNMQSYYTYHGSLTTPMCQEVVTWMVMDQPIIISDEQYKILTSVDVGGINNFRSIQPTNRVVYRSSASCSLQSSTFLGFLALLISCSTSNISAGIAKAICNIVNLKKKLIGQNVFDCSKLI